MWFESQWMFINNNYNINNNNSSNDNNYPAKRIGYGGFLSADFHHWKLSRLCLETANANKTKSWIFWSLN